MYGPVFRLGPVIVDHDVNVGGAAVVVARVDGGHLYHTVGVGVPTTTEPGLLLVEVTGAVPTVLASCIG